MKVSQEEKLAFSKFLKHSKANKTERAMDFTALDQSIGTSSLIEPPYVDSSESREGDYSPMPSQEDFYKSSEIDQHLHFNFRDFPE